MFATEFFQVLSIITSSEAWWTSCDWCTWVNKTVRAFVNIVVHIVEIVRAFVNIVVHSFGSFLYIGEIRHLYQLFLSPSLNIFIRIAFFDREKLSFRVEHINRESVNH